MTGYDLNKAFEQTAQHFWTTDQSQIYRALYRMEENAWVEVETVIQEDSPNKKVYRITEAGRSELQRWIVTPLAESPVREGWLGQVFFGGEVDNAAIIQLLESYRAEIETRLKLLEAIHEHQSSLEVPRRYRFQFLVAEYGMIAHRDIIKQFDYLIERIRQFPEKDADT